MSKRENEMEKGDRKGKVSHKGKEKREKGDGMYIKREENSRRERKGKGGEGGGKWRKERRNN